ncbi:MAG: hypothetical protein LUG91_00845 [Ruminococcus sp.]|nr:hypothetical protein [Ruminococcus sp.]
MNVIEINEGTKIPYSVDGSYLNLDDDMILNLARREEDDPVHIDVCSDENGRLMNTVKGNCAFVATIDIPARAYTETESEGENGEIIAVREPVPFDINNVTLTLWALVDYQI